MYKIPCIEIDELIWRDISSKYGMWAFVSKRKAKRIKRELLKLIKSLP